MASLAIHETPLKTENGITIPSKDDRNEKILQMRHAFLNRIHLNRPWAYYLGLCEVLNFINILVQIYFTDWFLGGAFLGLGQAVAHDGQDGKVDALDVVFPKVCCFIEWKFSRIRLYCKLLKQLRREPPSTILPFFSISSTFSSRTYPSNKWKKTLFEQTFQVTKCIFHKYGPSGTIQNHDALCIMALNVVNEKIYIFLWYWFIILAVITGLGLLWRILTMILHSRLLLFFFYCLYSTTIS